MWGVPIIKELFDLLRTWLLGKQQVAQATAERKAELIRQEGKWEEIMAQASVTSWKDEWLTLLFSIPMVLCFVGAWGRDVVAAGFASLAVMPDWYQYTVSVIVAASFGVRSAIGLKWAKAETQAHVEKAKRDPRMDADEVEVK